MNTPMPFHEKLKATLEEQNKSQRQVADTAALSPSQLSRIVRGEKEPSLEELYALSRALDMDPTALIAGTTLEAGAGFAELLAGERLPLEDTVTYWQDKHNELRAEMVETQSVVEQLREQLKIRQAEIEILRQQAAELARVRQERDDLKIDRDAQQSRAERALALYHEEREGKQKLIATAMAYQEKIKEQEKKISEEEAKGWVKTGLGVVVGGLVGALIQSSSDDEEPEPKTSKKKKKKKKSH